MIVTFLNSLIGKFYKILALNDDKESGLGVDPQGHIGDLLIELEGALQTFPVLATEEKFISLVNSVNYLRIGDFNKATCKKVVFSCITNIKKLVSWYKKSSGGVE